MAYRRKDLSEVERPNLRSGANFVGVGRDLFKITSLPMAVSSYILDSIGFNRLVDTSLKWDPSQCDVSPGDAIRAMVLTMVMSGYRPALENVHSKFSGQPLPLYFESVSDYRQLDPDMLARTLTKLHESDDVKLFMNVSSALRARLGLKTRAVHSDTTSVSVEGSYDRYDEQGRALVRDSEGALVYDEDTIVITRGYSKDRRPDLLQYMIGEAVDENGIPVLSKPLDGNTADSRWNEQCLDLLKDMLRNERVAYVADSKVVNDPLVSEMIDEGIMFLSRCPANFNSKVLAQSLMEFNLDDLHEIPDLSPKKGAAKRRIVEGCAYFKGTRLRTVLVETSTLAGRGEKAIERQRSMIESKIAAFDNVFDCEADARNKGGKLLKSLSKSIFDVDYEIEHAVIERRPKGRPRKDGTDIRRADKWTYHVKYSLNETKAEELRRREGYIMLISNIPSKEEDPEIGMTAEELVRLYGNEWKVEAAFHCKKRPLLVERLFIKDPARAEALITVVNIAALIRAVIQVMLRKAVNRLSDEDLPLCGRSSGPLQRNVTADFFIDNCSNCYLQCNLSSHSYALFGGDDRALIYLELLGIPPEQLFSGSDRK